VPDDFRQEDFTVILPTYNEAGNIVRMLSEIRRLYPNVNILVMDDDSPDGTGRLVADSFMDDVAIRSVVRKDVPRGLSASIIDGIQGCGTPFFIVMDADFQHPPAEIKGLMSAMAGGADICVGVRRSREALGRKRKFYSQGAEMLSRLYLCFIGQASSRDNMSGFFAARSDMVSERLSQNASQLQPAGFKILFDVLKFLPPQVRLAEWEYDFGTREEGESKIGSGIIISILRQCGRLGGMAADAYALVNKR
jgi:dolichol-phosphate mannosyltransferase